MSTDKTGGPAYPFHHKVGEYVDGGDYGHSQFPVHFRGEGMTLLDRYAIAAMQGILAKTVFGIAEDEHEQLAWASYEIAGEMLRARERYTNGEGNQ